MAKIVQMGIGLIFAFLASFPLFGGTIVGKVVLEGKYDPAGRTTMDSDALIRFQRFEIKSEASHGRGFYKTAAGTFEVKFYHEQEKEDLYSCEALATDVEKTKMKKAYDKASS